MLEKIYKGYNGTIILNDRGLVIKRGLRGALLGGGFIRGDKTIPYTSIVAVQLKKAGMLAGYIQFTLSGGSDAKGGVFQSARDENSINFHRHSGNNEKFAELKALVEERIGGQSRVSSSLDDLEKLAGLRDKGIITEEEFQNKKAQLLS